MKWTEERLRTEIDGFVAATIKKMTADGVENDPLTQLGFGTWLISAAMGPLAFAYLVEETDGLTREQALAMVHEVKLKAFKAAYTVISDTVDEVLKYNRPNAYRQWTSDDNDMLRAKWGQPVKVIAKEMGRTPNAIRSQAKKLGLTLMAFVPPIAR